ncbi:MAG TPA: pentapeptide repeat-containing protein [Ktedonobacterales bacterium]
MNDSQAPKPADAWGQPISAERQAELQGCLDQWAAETEHGERQGPFDWIFDDATVRLTGADVFWLAGRARKPLGAMSDLHLERANLVGAHLEGAWLTEAHLEGATLTRARLDGATLAQAHLEEADLSLAHLDGADLRNAHLECANLIEAHMEGANLYQAYLRETDLGIARLERATLSSAHLEGADLRQAHLENAKLVEAHLEGARLTEAHLEAATLRGAWLNSKTVMTGAIVNRRTALGDIQWGGVGAVNLTSVTWRKARTLGDERGVGPWSRAVAHEGVVRAYRQVAEQLRAQGMSEMADRYVYRAQVRQRGVLLRRLRLPQLFGAWVLAVLAGYGYRPGRTIFWYFVVVTGFTAMYIQASNGWVPFGLPAPSTIAPLQWYEALILSVSAFHGRGFFQPVQRLGDPIAVLAAIEAVLGLFIEISFIATFTRRYFGNR